MKKLLYLLPLLFFGCEKSYPTYYDIDGEYVISRVTMIAKDGANNIWDTTYYSGDIFSMYNPKTPLDSFTVGVTRFKFTNAGKSFMWNLDPNSGNINPWLNEVYVTRRQDPLNGEWDMIRINFNDVRQFEDMVVGIDDFDASLKQYPYFNTGY